jgi:CRP-like cAMP-binding protein
MQQLNTFLQSSGLVSSKSAIEIAAQFTPKELQKGDYFLKAGRVADEYLFLSQGFMRAFAIDTESNEVTTAFYSSDNVVFEVSSFFNRKPSRENIQALTDCNGYCLSYEKLNMLFHSMPEFRDFGRSILVKGFSALKDRMLSTITETAEWRYEKLLSASPEIVQQAPLKYIASYLGITDTSLSRIRKELSKKNERD